LQSTRSSGTGFRDSLFYRLNVMPIRFPPLHERHADILALAEHFLDQTTALLKLLAYDATTHLSGTDRILEFLDVTTPTSPVAMTMS
jgi:transcriptional regulator with GAF, ATPase, and Fis domain